MSALPVRRIAVPPVALPAFYLIGLPLLIFLALVHVALVFGVLGEPTGAFVSALGALFLPAIPIFVARSKLLQGGILLRDAQAANERGDTATATRAATRILQTVYRADVRASAIFHLATASARTGAHVEAAELFLAALAALPPSLKTGETRRVTAIACARAAMHAALAGMHERATTALTRAEEARAEYRGGFSVQTTTYGHHRLDAVLAMLEGRRAPEPFLHLATVVVAARTGDHATARGILEREGPALSQILAPLDRTILDDVATSYRALPR